MLVTWGVAQVGARGCLLPGGGWLRWVSRVVGYLGVGGSGGCRGLFVTWGWVAQVGVRGCLLPGGRWLRWVSGVVGYLGVGGSGGCRGLFVTWGWVAQVGVWGCLFVACLTSQQHAAVSQAQVCSDKFTCSHTQIELEFCRSNSLPHPVTVY